MLLTNVRIGTTNVSALERFHREVLQLPVTNISDTTIDVEIGPGVVRYEQRDEFSGAHHLAFSVAPEDFDQVRSFLSERVDLLRVGDSSVVDGPEGWNSRSVYFTAPDGLILEYIAHESYRGRGGDNELPAPFGIAEVGIGVADVATVVGELGSQGLPPFPPHGSDFAPVGDVDGLLIVVSQDRLWFPEKRNHPATDTATISIVAPGAVAGTIAMEHATLIIN
ncbi:MAG: VOC family protein [Thermomicrobiales bacterium]|nr:VOC family protein [Thermomicrobiales bacterium]